MKLTKNFSLEEFITSPTAIRNNIDNTPDENAIKYINIIAIVLQKIRDRYGKPIIINSGYRCEELNKLIGGVSNSEHLIGAAVDIRSLSNTKIDNAELFDTIVKMVTEGEIELRQIINEHNHSWVHISVNNDKNVTKINQILNL